MDLDDMFGAFNPTKDNSSGGKKVSSPDGKQHTGDSAVKSLSTTTKRLSNNSATSNTGGKKRRREDNMADVEKDVRKMESKRANKEQSHKRAKTEQHEESKQEKATTLSEEESDYADEVDLAALQEGASSSSDQEDVLDREDEDLAAEGARILAEIEREREGAPAGEAARQEESADDEMDGQAEISRVRKLGYNADDFEIETFEYDNCVHEAVYPRGHDKKLDFKRPKVAAKQYEFTLDKFQERAVLCIEKDESVLVAAHTSAGKTAIAEYAIAKSLKG